MNNDEIRGSYRHLRMQNVPREDAIKHLAEELGRTPEVVRGVIDKKPVAETFDADNGFTAKPSRDGFSAFATSTLYRGKDEDGEIVLQWVKESRNNSRKAAQEFVAGMAEDLPKLEPRQPEKVNYSDDLLAIYPMGDPHFGMMSWKSETGADFDLKIAETNLCAAVDHLVKTAPTCKNALVISVGDFFHADNKHAHTTNSLHTLDMDSRYGKMLTVGIKAFRQCIESALDHHEHVTVICALGNHDWHTSMFLSVTLKHVYEDEPRVTVMDSFAPRTYYRFFNNLVGVTHGDQTKADSLPLLMASERKEDWGETEHRIWITGHVHHTSVKEYPGCTVETINTLAPRDAWHAEKGYLSGRNMKVIIQHRDYGEVGRNTVSIQMLEA
jgi:hypothetical protein